MRHRKRLLAFLALEMVPEKKTITNFGLHSDFEHELKGMQYSHQPYHNDLFIYIADEIVRVMN